MAQTIQDVVSKFPATVTDKYDFTRAVYTGALERITGVVCPDHGEFSQYSARFRKGSGCPSCGVEVRASSRRSDPTEYFAKVAAIHGGKYTYPAVKLANMNSRITVTCPDHGDFEINANHHYYRKQGCGACENTAKKTRIINYRHLSAQSKIDNTAVTFFQRCAESHAGKYTYPEQAYKGAKEKITIACPDHGEFQQAAWAHLSGKGCPKCGAYTPKWEMEVTLFIENLGFVVNSGKGVLAGKDIDVLVESRNFGVELNGLHWHTEKKRSKTYHYDKWKTASDMGVQLMQVFEDEWVNNKHVVLNRIKAALGKTEKYDARKTMLGIVPSSEAKLFLEETHSQGAGTAHIYYGLRYEGEWVAVASFGKARSGAMTGSTTGAWEVIRYASKGRVRGGFSKLFKRFLEDYQPNEVISYCDLRYGTGSVYQACGFELDGITDPDYWWVQPGKMVRTPRYQTQKHKLPTHPALKEFYDPLKTEIEICHAAGWYRIYGVGHQRWLWRPPV